MAQHKLRLHVAGLGRGGLGLDDLINDGTGGNVNVFDLRDGELEDLTDGTT